MEEKSLRILELYSGIGGMHYAASLSGHSSEIVMALDINTSANEVYKHNFPGTNQQSRNIQSIKADEINKLKPDVIMMSPPCQPFTRVGLKLDVNDPRCSSFLHLVEILEKLETVTHILMENVVGFEVSEMRDLFVKSLKNSKFCFREFIISPDNLGIPNSRSRYYLIARANEFAFGHEDELLNDLPISSLVPRKGIHLESYLEELDADETNKYLIPDRVLVKYIRVLDVRQRTDKSSCCFTKAYSHYVEGTGSILQANSGESLTEQFNKFVENGDNIEHLKCLKLRYFTPKEISNLMGFPDTFSFPAATTLKTKYRLLGNSLNVEVVSMLFNCLIK